jgi:hypothetical protein
LPPARNGAASGVIPPGIHSELVEGISLSLQKYPRAVFSLGILFVLNTLLVMRITLASARVFSPARAVTSIALK